MALQTQGIIIKNEGIKPGYFHLEIYCPPIADKIKPGQFIMLKISNNNYPLLRRPFSVYKTYPSHHPNKENRGCLIILYKKVGKGTQKMTEFKKEQRVDMIGPLGNGFTLPSPSPSQKIILIGGGVGIVTLYPLAEACESKTNLFIFIGGRTKKDILCVEDFKKIMSNIWIATEDGSSGYKGTVIDLFRSHKKKLMRDKNCSIYSCGPVGMLKELADVLDPKKFPCEISFEARMGCGFGACWGCVVKTKDPKTPYQRVCKEGPVFNLEKIVWE